MTKYIEYNTLLDAEAAQLEYDKKLGYVDENGNFLYATKHAFGIIEHPYLDKWALVLESVSGMQAASIEFRGKQLPLEAISGTAVIRAVVGDDAVIKTEGQMRADEWFIRYEQGQPIEGTY